MRVLGLALVTLSACSRIAGIDGEFRAVDSGADGLFDGPSVDAAVIAQRSYIKASNPGAGDLFGYASALSRDGSTLAVAAPMEDSSARGINGPQDDETRLDSGAVYVFVRAGDSWIQEAYLKASNADETDRFGYSVGISDDGNTLLVGAPFEDSSGVGPGGTNNNLGDNAGAAYVFTRSAGTWTEQRYLKASNTEVGDQFGYFVALSGDGNTAAITAVNEDSAATGVNGSQASNAATDAGAVYVLIRTPGTATWTQRAYLKASNTEQFTYFGRALAMSADGYTLAVASPFENRAGTGVNNPSAGTASNSGAAYVFLLSGGTWMQQAYIKASNTGADDEFGWSVGLSANGNTLIVGAPNEDGGVPGINGNPADNASTLNSGAGYVFVRSGTTWSEQAYVKTSNLGPSDQAGFRVAVAPDGTFALGALHEDSATRGPDGPQNDEMASSSGASYVFGRAGSDWVQRHYLKASNAEADDHFGYLGVGSVFCVGAPDEDSAAPGINGAEDDNTMMSSGAVYLFDR